MQWTTRSRWAGGSSAGSPTPAPCRRSEPGRRLRAGGGQAGPVIELRSDNAAGVAPEILAAIEAANTGSALAYGGDDLTAHLHDVVREVFEHPTARVFPV